MSELVEVLRMRACARCIYKEDFKDATICIQFFKGDKKVV